MNYNSVGEDYNGVCHAGGGAPEERVAIAVHYCVGVVDCRVVDRVGGQAHGQGQEIRMHFDISHDLKKIHMFNSVWMTP